MQAELPSSLAEWVGLAVQVGVLFLAVAGFVWRFLKQPIEQQINGLGGRVEQRIAHLDERVKEMEGGCTHHGTLIDKHDRAIERLENAMAAGHERIGRIEGALERMVTAMEFNRTAHLEDNGEIRERLVRIETKVDAIQAREDRATPNRRDQRA